MLRTWTLYDAGRPRVVIYYRQLVRLALLCHASSVRSYRRCLVVENLRHSVNHRLSFPSVMSQLCPKLGVAKLHHQEVSYIDMTLVFISKAGTSPKLDRSVVRCATTCLDRHG